jgi:hypothetical protein
MLKKEHFDTENSWPVRRISLVSALRRRGESLPGAHAYETKRGLACGGAPADGARC